MKRRPSFVGSSFVGHAFACRGERRRGRVFAFALPFTLTVALGCSPARPSLVSPRAAAIAPACPAIHGVDAIPEHGLVLVGEIHGTDAVPARVGDTVCVLAARGDRVVLALEVPTDEQAAIDVYLASSGSPRDRGALVGRAFWQRDDQDGRTSEAMLGLLERVRALRASGRDVRIFAFDVPVDQSRGLSQGKGRDRSMARTLATARTTATTLVLTGNLHARTTIGSPWDDRFVPMGHHLHEAHPDLLSFNAVHPPGHAWVCFGPTPADCGDHVVGGKEDRGTEPFLERLPAATPEGYTGALYVGPVHASPPARNAVPRPIPIPTATATATPRARTLELDPVAPSHRLYSIRADPWLP